MICADRRPLFFLLLFLAQATNSVADTPSQPGPVNSGQISEVWLNPGFYSWHFDRDRDLDGNNYGLGMEYRYTGTQSVMAGRYHNSDRQMSTYAAWLWQPFSYGPFRIGALAGVIDGYPRAKNGDWFAMAIPVASYEHKDVGINLTIVPTIPDTVYGSITIQLKLKVY